MKKSFHDKTLFPKKNVLKDILFILNSVIIIIIVIIAHFGSFSHVHKLMVFYWSLSDSKPPHIFMTILSILAENNNAVVWTITSRLLISNFSSPSIDPLVTTPRAPFTIGITNTFLVHSFFRSLARSRYLSLFSLSFSFTLWSVGTANSTIKQFLFFIEYHLVWSTGRDYIIRLLLCHTFESFLQHSW